MRVFLDCSGVLSDFERGFREAFGRDPSRCSDDTLWDLIREHGAFFSGLAVKPDAHELVDGIRARGFEPTVITGLPWSVPYVQEAKEEWLATHFPTLTLICCYSKEKYKYGQPGDLMIDDRPNGRRLWTSMGGRWINHHSAALTLSDLDTLLAIAGR